MLLVIYCVDGTQWLGRGRVAEWPNASVLKTEVLQGTGGSNPSSSDGAFWKRMLSKPWARDN